MDPTELKRLAASTPVHDARRYALRWAAGEIERLQAALDSIPERGGLKVRPLAIVEIDEAGNVKRMIDYGQTEGGNRMIITEGVHHG